MAQQVDATTAQELEKNLNTVSAEMSKLNPDRNSVVSAAGSAAPVAQRLADRLAGMQYSSALALGAMQKITEDAEEISLADERAAEQAAMALDSLYIAYSKEAKPANAAEVRAAINGLFQQLENPSSYNADQFAAALRRIHEQLR
jgi:ABC-type transporter Mla subunit MlaD